MRKTEKKRQRKPAEICSWIRHEERSGILMLFPVRSSPGVLRFEVRQKMPKNIYINLFKYLKVAWHNS